MTLVDPATGEVVADCSPDEARQLTERIRSAADTLCQLLAEAHDRGAWRALGYDSFNAYVSSAAELLGDLQIIEVPAPEVTP